MNDTIAAIATAYGEGGIGIIRISGPDALKTLHNIFECAKPIKSRRMTFGKIIEPKTGNTIDEALVVYMKAPTTYTGEDVVEINCHGSMISLRKTLQLVLKQGVRMAEPGEFTKNAFLNGRMDLSQAEAVIDVIKAKTDKSFDVAIAQMEGSLSRSISEIRKNILDMLVDITVNIDYPEEDIEEITYAKLKKDICETIYNLDVLLATANSGKMIREGIRIAIVGKPNVGKSSLMNELLGQSRAIVTEIPGTTRDSIEEAVSIRNLPVYLIDTAGIRQTEDVVEKIGIEKSKEAFNNADFIIFIVDGSTPLTQEDEMIISHLKGKKALALINKTDIAKRVTKQELAQKLSHDETDIIETALIRGEGIRQIEDKIEELVYGGKVKQEHSMMVSNVRHEELLRKSRSALEDAMEMTKSGQALDIIEIDVRNAYDFLGEIIGETVSDEIINEVFSRFCLGK